MNIFDGLESLGVKADVKVEELYTKAKKPAVAALNAKAAISPADLLYQKTYVCPACETEFQDATVKKGKVRYLDSDSDLKPNYEPIDPMYYEIVMCKKCGYTAAAFLFNKLLERQAEAIRQKITPNFKPHPYPEVLDVDSAIERYKMALYNTFIKGGKSGEKAYLCLKLAWLYRDRGDADTEMMFLKNAYLGLKEAYSAESFPICGLDEPVVAYIIGELARRLGDLSEALRWIGNVIIRKNVNARLKDRAITAKELIAQERKKTDK